MAVPSIKTILTLVFVYHTALIIPSQFYSGHHVTLIHKKPAASSHCARLPSSSAFIQHLALTLDLPFSCAVGQDRHRHALWIANHFTSRQKSMIQVTLSAEQDVDYVDFFRSFLPIDLQVCGWSNQPKLQLATQKPSLIKPQWN